MDPRVARRLLKERRFRALANYLLVELEMGLGRTRMLGRPYWLTVDPTNHCQLRCPFCPTGAGRNVRPKSSMRLEDFRRILDMLGPCLIHIDFMNWGEPLLNRETFAMVAEAKRRGIDTMISTNLNALADDGARKLVSSGLDRLVVSADGLSQETYSRYRVGGDYPRLLANLRAVAAEKRRSGSLTPRIVWQFLVFRHNEHEIDSVRATALAEGADEVGITPANMPFKPGIRENWLPTRREYSLYDPETFPDSPPWHWDEAKAKGDGLPPAVDVEVYAEGLGQGRSLCNWPWAGLAVNPDGSVSPCCSIEEQEYDFGNIFQTRFRELWNNELYRKARGHVLGYVNRKARNVPNSRHACERCFSIGKARFQFPTQWLEPRTS
jgi:radical SAM protein with 4Fe4S-binding SPASM domain